MPNLTYLALGLVTGIFSGMLGLGGGFIIIPALIYLYGLSQHQAQGTALAVMVPPITLLAALKYYNAGNVKLGMAVFIACGFALGGFLGAGMAHNVSGAVLKKVFGAILLFVSVRMILSK